MAARLELRAPCLICLLSRVAGESFWDFLPQRVDYREASQYHSQGNHSGVGKKTNGFLAMIWPDPKWIDALKLPITPIVGVAATSAILLTLYYFGVIPAGWLSPYILLGILAAGILAGCIGVLTLVAYLFRPYRERKKQELLSARRSIKDTEKKAARAELQAAVLYRLDYLSAPELRYLYDCIEANSSSFQAYVYSPPVTLLQGKGLVWTPGGPHHQDHYPFLFYDFVWKEALARKDEFLARHKENLRAEAARERASKNERRR
jgi:hypothetical protein